MSNDLYVVTGTPGTGKTTLLERLGGAGIAHVTEPARPLLTRQVEIDGPDLPSKSPLRFVRAMLRQMETDFERASKQSGVVLFDRGIPDLVAYARRFQVESDEFAKAGAEHRYNPKVFILPPWKEIFVNDDLRKLSYEESLKFHDELVMAYASLGYRLTEVPRIPVEERVDFVLDELRVGREE